MVNTAVKIIKTKTSMPTMIKPITITISPMGGEMIMIRTPTNTGMPMRTAATNATPPPTIPDVAITKINAHHPVLKTENPRLNAAPGFKSSSAMDIIANNNTMPNTKLIGARAVCKNDSKPMPSEQRKNKAINGGNKLNPPTIIPKITLNVSKLISRCLPRLNASLNDTLPLSAAIEVPCMDEACSIHEIAVVITSAIQATAPMINQT